MAVRSLLACKHTQHAHPFSFSQGCISERHAYEQMFGGIEPVVGSCWCFSPRIALTKKCRIVACFSEVNLHVIDCFR